jgi:hypothetical protein
VEVTFFFLPPGNDEVDLELWLTITCQHTRLLLLSIWTTWILASGSVWTIGSLRCELHKTTDLMHVCHLQCRGIAILRYAKHALVENHIF